MVALVVQPIQGRRRYMYVIVTKSKTVLCLERELLVS